VALQIAHSLSKKSLASSKATHPSRDRVEPYKNSRLEMPNALAYLLIVIGLGPIIVSTALCLWLAFSRSAPFAAWKRIGYGFLGFLLIGIFALLGYGSAL
jgi:hypothetical protein